MKLKVNGFACVTSRKDNRPYTIVHGTSDMPFSNGKGFQNYNAFLNGHVDLEVGRVYEAVTDTYMQGDQLITRVTGLK